MKLNLDIDLTEIYTYDGETIASAIAGEIVSQIKNKVKRELKDDPRVSALIAKIKDAAVSKMLSDFDQ